MTKILIAPDSFKGSLRAQEVAKAMERGIQRFDHTIETCLLPVADGGEGTMDALIKGTNGKIMSVQVTGPLGESVQACYGVLGDDQTVVIEIAEAAGLALIQNNQLNPLHTTTFGVGQLIASALDEGYRHFIIALGGSATNDGGAGMLQALGAELLDQNGQNIPFGGVALHQIETIKLDQFDWRIQEATFLIATDVDNPLIGPNGASAVFGPQKGATPQMITVLDENLCHFANQIEHFVQHTIHYKKGAGAAGGLGGAFQAFFPSTTASGIDLVLQKLHFEHHVQNANLVISGEGKIDTQTAYGKTPFGVAKAANEHQVPTILIGGIVEEIPVALYEMGVVSAISIINGPQSIQDAMSNAETLIEQATEQCVRLFFAQR